ncbi:MAG: LysR family transcriptional regulator [Microbacteriaceae bacterium]
MRDAADYHHHLESLMTFLAVARLGRYTAAGESLGVNHSTVSRRIRGLEAVMGGRVLTRTPAGWEVTELGQRALASAEEVERALAGLSRHADGGEISGMVRIAAPDAFSTYVATPAFAALQREHPGLVVEVISATQRVRQNRSGVDLEIVIGKPFVHKAVAAHVLDYSLGLYASPEYLDRAGHPRTIDDLAEHRLNYYIESALRVDDLDRATDSLPPMRRGIFSTSVFAQVAATVAGAGIGLLPTFLADGRDDLLRVLPDLYNHELSYWAVVREEALRSPVVTAAFAALREAGAHAASVVRD